MAFLRMAAGVLAAGLVFGLAQLVAVFTGASTAPLYALGDTVVDRTPDGLREWAIQSFGTHDKTVLFLSMGVVAVLVAAGAGLLERTRGYGGSAVFAVLGVFTALLAIGRSGSVAGALPAVVGTIAGIAALRASARRIDLFERAKDEAAEPVTATGGAGAADPPAVREGRRRVLFGLAGTGVLAAGAGLAGGLLRSARGDVGAERAAVTLPAPRVPTPGLPADADLPVPGLTPYVTANSEFYRIDTALIVPQVSKESWSLRIHGLVEREIRLGWDDLARRAPVERLITLACVSNPVGGDLIGNARWLGYRLDELLAEAGPLPEADMVLSHSSDGWTAGTPLAALTDGRDALLAVGMNGEPLPVKHGYPARLVVPGLYGYVSATKWVTELEVTRFDRATAYWTRRGWSDRGPIKTGTRIDTPGARIRPGRTVIAGVAWAQHRGVAGVEVQVDDGPWLPARLSAEVTTDTWRQWVLDWDATAGPHTLRARAIDETGRPQTAVQTDVVPDGATGYPTRTVQVA
ncbi:molybdopterin-dependent oxidoreductase [Nocardia thailandica]|uniref:Molybdopterin-dependent oxidoreductase n=1 Tax=Nocardia thailandica TaxID=257275 RepID=A0ABW6PKJ0_9NOCA